MSHEERKSAQLISLSSSPIYQHGEASAWQPAVSGDFIEQISVHIETHLGPIEGVLHEIDIHVVKPTQKFPFIRLVTSGMSDLPMMTPEDPDIPRYIELMMTLPADWKLDQASFNDETWYWPVRLLKSLARLPHKYQTWLG